MFKSMFLFYFVINYTYHIIKKIKLCIIKKDVLLVWDYKGRETY